jgi:hypothetical protein
MEPVRDSRKGVFAHHVIPVVAAKFNDPQRFAQALTEIVKLGESLEPGSRSWFYVGDVPKAVEESRGDVERLMKGLSEVVSDKEVGEHGSFWIRWYFGSGVSEFIASRAECLRQSGTQRVVFGVSSHRPAVSREGRVYKISLKPRGSEQPLEVYEFKRPLDENEVAAVSVVGNQEHHDPSGRLITPFGPKMHFHGPGGSTIDPVMVVSALPPQMKLLSDAIVETQEPRPLFASQLGDILSEKFMRMIQLGVNVNYAETHPHPFVELYPPNDEFEGLPKNAMFTNFRKQEWTEEAIIEEIRRYHDLFTHFKPDRLAIVDGVIHFNAAILQWAEVAGGQNPKVFRRLIAEAQRRNATPDPRELGSIEEATRWRGLYAECEKRGGPGVVVYTDR